MPVTPEPPRGALVAAERIARTPVPVASRRAGRSAALLLSAVACLGCLIAGLSLLLDGRLGFEALLALRAREGWPLASRLLVGIAALAALGTAALRVERASWREAIFGALAWLGVGCMLGAWAALMPSAPPPRSWMYLGFFGGMGVGLVLRLLLGVRGLSSGLRDALLTGVAGVAMVWAAVAF